MNVNDKISLTGGRLGEIYRQHDVVFRPAKLWTADVQRFLRFLCDAGVDFVPVPLGINEKNEEMLSYLPGVVHNYPLPAVMLTDKMIISAASLLRTFHDRSVAYLPRLTGTEPWMLPVPTVAAEVTGLIEASGLVEAIGLIEASGLVEANGLVKSTGFIEATEPIKAIGSVEVMCHGDYAPYNVTVLNGEAVGIIDFDTLRPGPRWWDVAYAAYRFAPLSALTTEDAVAIKNAIRRAGSFLAAYGITQSDCGAFVPVLTARLQALTLFMQTEAQKGDPTFQRHIAEGHLTLYQKDLAWLQAHTHEITYEAACACCFSAHRVTVSD